MDIAFKCSECMYVCIMYIYFLSIHSWRNLKSLSLVTTRFPMVALDMGVDFRRINFLKISKKACLYLQNRSDQHLRKVLETYQVGIYSLEN